MTTTTMIRLLGIDLEHHQTRPLNERARLFLGIEQMPRTWFVNRAVADIRAQTPHVGDTLSLTTGGKCRAIRYYYSGIAAGTDRSFGQSERGAANPSPPS